MRTSLLSLAAVSLSAAFLTLGTGTSVAAQQSAPASIALGTVNGSRVAATPSLGASVTFATSYASTVRSPRVQVACYQNGTLVWGEVGLPTDTYKLGGDSSAWKTSGGAASCTATLADMSWKNGVETTTMLASTHFDA